MLKDILHDLTSIDDVLFIVKNNGVVSEIRSNYLKIHQKEKWITIGDNDGPCHMHINSESIERAEFITEQKPDKISYSIRFFDQNNQRVLAGFITKMYDENNNPNFDRTKMYYDLFEKYGSKNNPFFFLIFFSLFFFLSSLQKSSVLLSCHTIAL